MPHARRVPRRHVLVLAALVSLLAGGCADLGPTPTPSSPVATPPVTPTPFPAEELPVPDADTAEEQVLLRDADGTFDRYRSIGQLQGGPAPCTAVLLDTGASGSAPAYALTTGRCVGIDDANEVVVDGALDGASVAFDWFADTPKLHAVPVERVAWATMRGTDLALLQLRATLDELRGDGLEPWHPEAVDAQGDASLDVVMVGVPVGPPGARIAAPERFLRLGTCGLDTAPVVLEERQWLWPGALRTDCPGVVPGNAGSAVLDRDAGGVVGLIATTTIGGEHGAECWLGRPCEVDEDGETSLPDTSYAMPVGGIEGCFAGDGTLALGGACPLDPGVGVSALDGAPPAVNPTAKDPVRRVPLQSTWATAVAGDGVTHYRYKVGSLDTTSCADGAGYGAPVPVATRIDDPLPVTEQRLLLCVVGGPSATPGAGWQAFVHAATAVAYVDTTPPTADIRFNASGGAAKGWRVEPVFDPPELSLFLVKSGPARSTDCAARSGYVPYRREPVVVPGRDAPARFCAIGHDDAGNASAPASKVLR